MQEPQTMSAPEFNQSADEIISLIQKLAELHQAGALSDDEFNSKKSELLSRL